MFRHAVLDLQCSGSWVVGDEVYVMDPCFREGLADLNLRFVLAVKRNMKVDKLPDSYWKPLATRAGERCPIRYEWAGLCVIVPSEGERWLLIRRSLKPPDDLAFYFSNAYSDTPIMQLAEVALRRFAIEQCFAEAKTEIRLDEYEVRLWHAWYRHITLSMMAHAFLSALKKLFKIESRMSVPMARDILRWFLVRRMILSDAEFFIGWINFKFRKRTLVMRGRYQGKYYRLVPNDVR